MKYLLAFLAVCCADSPLLAQMTLAHHFAGGPETEVAQVHLGRSGTKIVTLRNQNNVTDPDTLFFYNTNYTF